MDPFGRRHLIRYWLYRVLPSFIGSVLEGGRGPLWATLLDSLLVLPSFFFLMASLFGHGYSTVSFLIPFRFINENDNLIALGGLVPSFTEFFFQFFWFFFF